MTCLAAQGEDIDAILYTEMLEEMCKLLGSLGTALSIAFDGKSVYTNTPYRCQGKV